MKINVKIGEKNYEVEIEDLNARPVVALVDGVRVEVTPEEENQLSPKNEALAATPKAPAVMVTPANGIHLPAPLPGTVTEIFIKAGDEVESGQVVLTIEAMKMKNSIRSPRAGKVASVMTAVGQSVQHKQALLEFEK